MTTHEPLIAGLSQAKLDLLSKLVRDKGHRSPQTRETASPIARAVRADRMPLSFAQERLWFIDQLEPESAAYNVPHAVRLTGSLQVAALEQSVNEMVRRHEVLRTSFVDSAGQPAQQIASEMSIELPLVDLGLLSESEQRVMAQRLMREQARRPFDLRCAPLLRVQLVRLAEREHEFLFAMHHIASDGWSNAVLVREVGALYPAYLSGGQSPLAELAIQYADFAVWQRERLQGEVLDAELTYWKQQLAEAPEVLDLPADHARPRLESFRGDAQSFVLSESISRGLRELSQQSGTTLFMTLLAAFKTLLYRYTGQTDIVVGTPVANRNRVEIEPLIGFFANTLVLRTRVTPEASFRELLQQVRELVLGAQAHQELPFERLVQELAPERSLSHAPLFQVMLVLDNAPARELALPELQLQTIGEDSATAKFDLTLVLSNRESGELGGEIKYNAVLFDDTTIARLAQSFEATLTAIISDAEQPLRNVSLLSTKQRRQLLTEWNDTQFDFGVAHCLDELLEMQVERTPEAIALVYDEQQMTFAELNRRANQLAHHLQALGVGPEVAVALLVERSELALIGIWGILKAGGGYVPLDAAMPATRVAAILEDARPAVLLTQSHLVQDLSDLPRVMLLDGDWEAIANESEEAPVSAITPENLAYVIYTSGSTGRPKGVAVQHRSLANLSAALKQNIYTSFAAPLRVGLNATLTFDASVKQWLQLVDGHTLEIIPDEVRLDALEFVRYAKAHALEVVDCTPPQLKTLLEVEVETSLQAVLVGGDAIDEALWEQLATHPTLRFYNLYGPTECTDVTTARQVSEVTPTIGRPLPNVQTYFLDEYAEPVAFGVRGELCIGGAGVARGYLHQPELTADKFIPDAFGTQPGARLYRSGDSGRYVARGEIEFIGRVDDQVKIRGYRIELGEIEAVLAQHAAIRQCKVVMQEVTPGDKRLVAYVVGDEQPISQLRGFLKERLPDYMIPAAFVTLTQMPLTSSGKIDRNALPEPKWSKHDELGDVEPRTLVAEILAGVWSDVLGLEQVGVDENFFELGGHSLLAVQVASRVRTALEFELPLRWVFEAPTVRTLAERIEAAQQNAKGISLPPITRTVREETLPLSFAQERLWFLDQLEPGSVAYNIPHAVGLTGSLQVSVLEQSVNEIARRHEALRTSFVDAAGQPAQQIAAELRLELPLVDLRSLSASEQQEQAERVAREEARRPFDLRHAPLLRVRLLRLSEQRHQFLFTMHHIVSDGWSMNVVVRELVTLYEALHLGQPSSLTELGVQYADFAVWQRQHQKAAIEEQLDYWKAQLAAAPEVLELPADRPRPLLPSHHGAQQHFSLPASLHQSLKRLSRKQDATLFMTMLAAFQTLLYRYTGQADILVGTPVANRNRVEIEPLIGFFVNTLVLRTQLHGETSFRELLQQVREVVLGAQAHQELPFERLVQELAPERSLSHAPLFQVMLVLDNMPARQLELPGLQLQPLREDSATAKFDLTLALTTKHESGELCGVIEYNTDLFDATRMARLAEHFSSLLSAVVEDANYALARLPLLSAAERHRLLMEWNDTDAVARVESCVHEVVAAQSQLTPEAVALEFADEALTYAELNTRANQLAHYLRRRGVGPEVLVGLCLEPSLELVIGVLGILKAGGAYVPLDPAYPQERLSFMLADSQAPVIVTRDQLALTLPTNEAETVCVDRDWNVIAREAASDIESSVSPENLAYVIYTSGSTGRPKGAVIQHRSAVELLRWSRQVFGAEELQAVLCSTSICFDLSVFELFVPLSRGGKVVLVADALRLPTLAGREGVTLINTVPSVMAELLRLGGVPQSVQTINLAGEPLSATLVRQLHEQTNVQRVFDLYGPSEDTTYSTYTLRLPEGPVTIGHPITNTKAYALDSSQELMPSAVAGELYLGGRGLARGYLRRPELTAEKFIPNPFGNSGGERLYRTGDITRHLADGRLEYLGRRDHQVKLRGFRIELGEIEAALSAHAGVRENVVVVREQRLVAYVVGVAEQSELRSYLRERLPQYMVPSAFVHLDALPRLPNGKVNRKALPEPEWSERQSEVSEEEQTQLEQIVAGVWSDVLGLDQVGVDENFFELGGHSLLAVQVASRVRTALAFELPLRWVFEAPTVRTLAERIEQSAAQVSLPPITRTMREETLPLSFAQERLWFLDQLEPESAAYNIPGGVELTGSLQIAALEQSLSETVRRHEALRTSFVDAAGQPAQQIAAELRLELPLIDLQALTAAEQQREAERLVRQEARRPFDLRRAPLLRVRLLQLSEQRHQLLFTMHHIVSDGWSMNVVVRELVTLYEALHIGQPSSLTELGVQYADFAVWQRQHQKAAIEEQLDYWKAQLAAAPEVLELPADRPRPLLPSHHGAQQHFSLPASLHQALKRLSRKQDATLFMTMLAAFQTLLYRYTGQADILVGTPVANRNRVEIEPLIGFFVNTLVLRTQLHGEASFRELLQQVREVVLGAQAHQELPFERLVQELAPERNLSHAPLFQVMLVLDNMPARQLELPALQLQPLREDSATAKFDLTLALTTKHESGELRGVLEYNTDLFDSSRMARLAEHFISLLSAVVEDANHALARLPLLSAAERHRLLVDWNNTDAPHKRDICIHQLIEAQAEQTPDRIAIEFEGATLSYRELNRRANQLAHFLKALHVGPDVLVGVCLERSLEMIVAMLGTLKAGGAYVPLDPAYPAERIEFMLDDSHAPVLLTQERVAAENELDKRGAHVVCVDRDWSCVAQESGENIRYQYDPDTLAYVIYTSGSTGRPKGVAIQHSSAVALLAWANEVFTPDEFKGVLASTSICFDLSIFEIFVPLSSGGRVILVADALRLPTLESAAAVTLLNTVPSAAAELLRSGGLPPTIETVNLAGEPLATSLVRQLYDFGIKRVFDLYGPTEDTTYSTFALRAGTGQATIGRPVSNTKSFVLDQNLQPVPVGVPGELYLGGEGLARGYVKRAEMTAARFIPNPFNGGRVYKTGDLVRYLEDGRLEYLGRTDHQIKLRGFRIELGEIEAVLQAHAAVAEAIVTARAGEAGAKQLVAYQVGHGNGALAPSPRELREYVGTKLPQYMVPQAFVWLEQLPRLPNGKVNRKALPEPERSEREERVAGEPETQLEQIVAGVWSDVLGLDQVGVDENFFELGGHSLLAVQVASRVRTALAFELPLRWVFEAPTVRTLAERIEQSAAQVSLPPITRTMREETLPLSFAQERLWFIDQLEPESAAYNIPGGIQLTGKLQVVALEQSLSEMVRRHEALRTSFVDAAGQPAQQIAAELRLELPLVDLQGLTAAEQQRAAERLAREEARRPFDLRHAPLLRVRLLQPSEQRHQFLFTMHHIVSDGWSMNVVVRELVTLYEALHIGQPSSLTELGVQYADFAVWQRQHQKAAIEEQLDYWKAQLTAAPEVLELPADRPRPLLPSHHGAQQHFSLPASLHQALKRLSRKQDATLFMTMLAAFQTLLYRYTGQADILVGTPVANRNRVEIEPLIGFFVNTLVLRTRLVGEFSFSDLLSGVREVVLGAQAHQELPFERLVQELAPERSLSHAPLFQVMLVLDNMLARQLELPELQLQPLGEDSATAKFDLTLVLTTKHESGELRGVLEYNTDLFDATRIAQFAEHFTRVVESICKEPAQKLWQVEMLSERELYQILVTWNDTRVDTAHSQVLPELLNTQATQFADSLALSFKNEQVTYEELDRRSNQLARWLQQLGVGPEVLVGLFTERSLEMVIGLLGTLKAGGAYLPLDPDYPKDRLAYMLDDARPHLLLTQQRLLDRLPHHGARVVCLDADWDQIAMQNDGPVEYGIVADNPAYVIYTSGSTGRPKGAVISHRAICNHTVWMQSVLPQRSHDCLLQKTPFSFDASVWEFFAPLFVGARLVIAEPSRHQEPDYLARTINQEGVTIIQMVPSLLRALLQEKELRKCRSLRRVFCGGEALSRDLHEGLAAQLDAQLINLYGPTEATIDIVYCVCSPAEAAAMVSSVPIGRPIANTQVYILDGALQPVPVGVVGELYTSGDGLTRGYLGRPDLSAEKFIPNPFSDAVSGDRLYKTGDQVRHLPGGLIEFIGRVDHQVKLRGFRIELGEIEAALNSHREVRENVVVVREQRLVAYVVAVAEQTVSELRSYLRERLPQYMVPQAFVWLEQLPRLPNGKVNRKALPEPERSEEFGAGEPETQLEQIVAGVWSDVLGLDQVGVDENFFELGGHSLLAVQVASRVRTALAFELPLRWVFEAPTVRTLAERIEQSAAQVSLPPITRTMREETLPLSFAQERLWFIDQLEPESAAYNIPGGVELTGSLQVAALEQSLSEMVRRHEALRTSFVDAAGQPAQQIAAELRLELPLVDLQGLTAAEQEEQAERLVREEARRAFDLRRAPLLRVRLLRLSEQQHQFLFTMHHIVSDGWSMNVAVRELVTLYEALQIGQPSPLTELAIQYADFAVWQREWQQETILAQLAYWKEQLASAPPLDLPTDHRRTSDKKRSGQYPLKIPAGLSNELIALSRRESLTPFMILLAAYQLVLSRYSGQTDISVGTPVAGRDRIEVEELIGFFVNTLVMRTKLDPNWTMREFLKHVRETALQAHMHRDVQFERLVEELQPERRLDRSPLFQVMLIVQPAGAAVDWPGLEARALTSESGTAKFDLALSFVHDRNQVSGTLRYNAALFERATIARFTEAFETTLAAMVADLEQPLRNVQLLSTEQRRQLLTEWNDTQIDFGAARCLDELLEAQVSKTPDALALVYEEQQITFAELNRRANQLAHHLRSLGVGPEVAVALLVERGALSLISIWGILKAGGGYVPLDAAMPSARVAAILEDARPAVLLTQSHLVKDLNDVQSRVVLLDRDWEAIANESDEAPLRRTTPENLAYVIYTSGSTGRPKGVAVQHRSLANLSAALKQNIYTSFAAPLRVGLNATLTFDASVKQWLQLVDGHTLEIIPDEVRLDALEFVRYAKAHALEVVDCTPPQLKTLLEVEVETSLQAVLVGGDAIDETLWEQLATHPTISFYNLYGPTECTDVTTAQPVADIQTPTIGRPLANVQTYLLDEYAEPVPFAVRGELCIGGAGVARGYLHQPELTADKFIPDVFGLQPGARLYRSGDSGRYVAQGEIEFIGRVDDQVKIRGYRIEPGEIEAVLAQHAAVRQCKVLVQEVTPDDKRLVAYVVCDEQPVSQLRGFLKERLPDYMIPAAFVTLAQMPLTASGKVDRKALPQPEQQSEQPLELPRTSTEQQVAEMWSELLDLKQVSIHDNFFELGGHSLLLTQLASRMRNTMSVEMPLRSLFEAPTLMALAERIEVARQSAAGVSLPPITRALREETWPLSFAQERLWFIDQLEPESAAYNIPRAVQLVGSLQVAALEQSLIELVRRHEVLRTSFVSLDGRPVQQPEAMRVEVPLVDLRSLSALEQQEQAERLVREEAGRPFDLRQAPLLRAQLVQLSEARHEFLFTMHHIVSDGWSTGVLVREIGALYPTYLSGTASALPELEIQYADFAVWQREHLQGEVLDEELSYWKEQLTDAPAALELPTDHARPRLESFRGERQPLVLSETVSHGLRELSRQSGTTLFMTLLAAFQTLLYRYTGQSDILVGTPIANRNRVEIEPLIGFFVNTLVLRTQLNGDGNFRELLQQVREVVLGAQGHQELPFERLVQELAPERSLSHAPLFQVMMVLNERSAQKLELPELELQAAGGDSATAKFDLMLVFSANRESGELRGVLEYNADLFDETRMARLAEHCSSLLEAVVEDPEQPIARLPLLSAAERHRLLVEWNDTDSAEPPESCVHELFAAQSQLTPEAVAVEFEDGALTYAELNARANQLAHYLRRCGVGPEVLVGLCLEPSLELVIGVLGILKAGGAYVPLDPKYPQERLSFMLADSQTPVIVTQEQYTDLTDETRIVCLDRDWSSIAQESVSDIESGVSPDNLAYVIYTSGSTGRPKGAVIQHRSAVELLSWSRQVFGAEELRAVLGSTSICFDLSVFELFVPLSRGGKVVLVADALRLPALAGREGVTLINTVPSVMAELLRMNGVPQSVQTINLAGEPLSATLVRQLHEQTNVQRVFDLYGPSEDTTYSTYTLRLPEGPVTIGSPIANTKAYALDSSQELMPSAVAGELYLGGRGLARGYLRRPELTAEKFIPNPFSADGERLYRTGDMTRHLADGRLEYLGRRDHQVKLRGFRIELGEIEAALSARAEVRESVVVVREQRLVAYVVAVAEQSELRSYLRDKLPQYMVPQAFVWLEQLPRLPNGKVNRKALPEPERSEREERVAGEPETQLEQIVAGVWSDVLGLDQVGVEENFFELGGHSLLAVQVASRVRTALEFELPLRWVFEAPTVRALAEKIEAAQQSAKGISLPPIMRRLREETLSLSFAQERLWFIDQLEPESVAYNIPGGVELTGSLQIAALEQSLNETVRRHEALRTSFVDAAGQPAQQIAAELKLELLLIDLQRLSTDQQQEQTERLVREEARRPFDLRRAPLLRVRLLQLSEQRHQFLFTMHHIVSDGWSMNVAVRELVALYEALHTGQPSSLTELGVQYADFAVWQRQHQETAVLGQIGYWKQQLAAAPTLELPTDHRRGNDKKRLGQYSLMMSAALSSKLMRLAKQEGLTPFMILLAAYQLVLSRYSGQTDISVGTPVAGRDRYEVEELIGFFVNTLVMRTKLDPNWTMREFLKHVRETALQAHMHRDVQFERLVEELQPERRLDLSPLFQVMLIVQPAGAAVDWPGLEARALTSESGTAKFDLALSFVHDRNQVSGTLRYNAALFERATIARFTEAFETTLAAMAGDLEQPLRNVSLLTTEQRWQLLTEWNDTQIDFGAARCLDELLEIQVSKTPDALALAYDEQQITFEELNRRANQLAHHLQALGVGPEVAVALLVERSELALIGIWGVLKAGGGYVPLDAAMPSARVAAILEDARPAVLLTQSHLVQDLSDLPEVVLLDRDWEAIANESEEAPVSAITPENLAYVIYTSGSTGKPKGVAVQHRSLFNLAAALQQSIYTNFAAPLRVGLNATLTFDASVKQWLQVIDGHTLEIIPDEVRWDAREFLRYAKAHALEVVDCTPAQLKTLLEIELETSLQVVLVGGDAIDESLWEQLAAHPTISFYNLYGPTECSDVTTAVQISETRPTIGHPLPNVQTYFLDEYAEPVPFGVRGELCIGGAGVARGYLHQPELTADKFIPDAFGLQPGARLYRSGDSGRYVAQGEIEFIGRVDDQVKIRGYRIEPGEIEAVLAQHAAVRQCKVLVQEVTPADKRLVAYIVGEEPPINELRAFLKARLPEYMIPAAFVTLAQMPLTPSGKVDRKALPKPEQDQREQPLVLPRTPTEQQLADMWTELLGVRQVSIHDNFFDLGGHSLLLTQLASRMRNTMNVDVPLRSLFEAPTILEMGQMLSNWQVAQHDPAELAQLLGEIKNLTPQEIQAQLIELN